MHDQSRTKHPRPMNPDIRKLTAEHVKTVPDAMFWIYQSLGWNLATSAPDKQKQITDGDVIKSNVHTTQLGVRCVNQGPLNTASYVGGTEKAPQALADCWPNMHILCNTTAKVQCVQEAGVKLDSDGNGQQWIGMDKFPPTAHLLNATGWQAQTFSPMRGDGRPGPPVGVMVRVSSREENAVKVLLTDSAPYENAWAFTLLIA